MLMGIGCKRQRDRVQPAPVRCRTAGWYAYSGAIKRQVFEFRRLF
jgi:hypothetical protein